MAERRPKIACLLPENDENFTPEARRRLAEEFEWLPNRLGRQMNDQEKLAFCHDADCIIAGRSGGGLPGELYSAAARLKLIAVVGGTVRQIRPHEALEKGIAIINTPAGMQEAVAEYTLALMLMALRDIPYFIDQMKMGRKWQARRPYYNLTGKTVGLVGLGLIARRLVELLQPFHAKILVYDPFLDGDIIRSIGAEPVELDYLLSHSHIVSLHAGLTESTYHMIGKREIALMPPYTILINTARGALIDEEALVERLRRGDLVAALNVYEKEPLPVDHPLHQVPNAILTPHSAGKSMDTYRIQSESLVEDILRFFAGEKPHFLVTREMLERMT